VYNSSVLPHDYAQASLATSSGCCFFLNYTPTTQNPTLSLHDALPICLHCFATTPMNGPGHRVLAALPSGPDVRYNATRYDHPPRMPRLAVSLVLYAWVRSYSGCHSVLSLLLLLSGDSP